MSKYDKFIGKGEDLVIDGETVGQIKGLGIDYMPHLFKVMKTFSGAKDGDTGNMFSNMDDDGLKALKTLIDDTLKISFTDMNDEERSQFGMKYMALILPIIMKVNSHMVDNPKERKLQQLINKERKQ